MTDGGAGPTVGAAPQCYRHSGRETWISCSRCNRPICPDCMISAAVGFQCPDCVRASLNVLVYLFEVASASFVNRFWQYGAAGNTGVAHGQYYRLLTSMFLHDPPSAGGAFFLHILFNMWALYVVGPPLEQRLGRARFLVLYLLSGLAGSAAAYLLMPANEPVLGASGAIFGLFGALLVIGRSQRLNIQPIALTIGLNLVLSFSISGISWQGHIGGLVGGTALAAAWAYAPRPQRLAIQIASSVALFAIVVVVVLLRTHNLTH
jgi:membrane associated rhomboid family serine protease